jgi:hypothetical protein
MWLKQCHKLPIWEWFIPPISGDLVIWGMVYDCFNHIFLPLVVMDESNPFEKTYHNGKLTTQACKVAAFFFGSGASPGKCRYFAGAAQHRTAEPMMPWL